MKKLILLFVIAYFIVGCNLIDAVFYSPKMISIKGEISTSSKGNGSHVKSANAFSLADATKVLIFYGNQYTISDIKNGSFSAQAPEGSATVIAFLDANNQFIGNLFAGGLNMLPLVGLGNVTSIDLSTLTLDGTRVIPANDPIGNSIILTEQEVTFMKQVGAYYESLAKNIDTDNDGQPDIMTGTDLRINTQVGLHAGKWGLNDTKPVFIDKSKIFADYTLRIEGDRKMYISEDNVGLVGPEVDPYTNIMNSFKIKNSDVFQYYYRISNPNGKPDEQVNPPFKAGTYTFSLSSGKKYTFNYSNVNMGNYLVLVIPTFHTNDKNQLTSITYEYQLPDSTTVDPRNLLKSIVGIQLNTANAQQLYQDFNLYEKKNLTNYDYSEKNLPTPIDLGMIAQINIGYVDLLGNEYDIIWRNDFKMSY